MEKLNKKLSVLSVALVSCLTALAGASAPAYGMVAPQKDVGVKEAITGSTYVGKSYTAGDPLDLTGKNIIYNEVLDVSVNLSGLYGLDLDPSYCDYNGNIAVLVSGFHVDLTHGSGEPTSKPSVSELSDTSYYKDQNVRWFTNDMQVYNDSTCPNIVTLPSNQDYTFDSDFILLFKYADVDESLAEVFQFSFDAFGSADVSVGSFKPIKFNDMNYNRIKNGGSKTIHINYDSGKTQSDIVAGVSAEDLFGAPCSVTVATSDYVSGKVGTFHIGLTATDSYGNTATATLVVIVEDRSAPTVVKNSDISVAYGSKLTADDVLSHYTITDNVDKAFTYSWVLPANFQFNTALGFGVYTLGLTVSDSSGNQSKLDIGVNVYDAIPPVISRKDGSAETTLVYGYSTRNALTLDKILGLYSATDTISGDCAVYLKEGKLDTTCGDHTLTIASKDGVGNEAVKTINYHIQADIPPVFILSHDLIQCENTIALTVSDLTSIIATFNSTPSPKGLRMKALVRSAYRSNILINEDDFNAYLADYQHVGAVYNIRYSYTDAGSGEIKNDSVNVKIVGAYAQTDDRSGWDKFLDFFRLDLPNFFSKTIPDFFQRLKNVLSFKGWKTDSEVEADKTAEPESSVVDPSSDSVPASSSVAE